MEKGSSGQVDPDGGRAKLGGHVDVEHGDRSPGQADWETWRVLASRSRRRREKATEEKKKKGRRGHCQIQRWLQGSTVLIKGRLIAVEPAFVGNSRIREFENSRLGDFGDLGLC